MSRRMTRRSGTRRMPGLSSANHCLFECLEDRRLMSGTANALPSSPFLPPGPSNGPGVAGFTPAQIAHAYGFDTITFSGNIKGNGAGQTIAIVDAFNDPSIKSDLNVTSTPSSAWPLPPASPSSINPAAPPSSHADAEKLGR